MTDDGMHYMCLSCKWSRIFADDTRVYCRNMDCKTYPYGIKDECSCSCFERRERDDTICERW